MISPLREPHDQVFGDYYSHRAQADFLTRREQPAAKVSRIARKLAAAAAEEGPDSAASAGSDAGCATGQPEVAALDNDAVAHEGAVHAVAAASIPHYHQYAQAFDVSGGRLPRCNPAAPFGCGTPAIPRCIRKPLRQQRRAAR